MTAHVFVVDVRTFPIHLRYRFAGTGAKDHRVDFNRSPSFKMNATTERNLVSMISDIVRIREGDGIIFYVQQQAGKMPDGKFYGIFRATQEFSFIDNNDGNQFLMSELGKSLTFRTLFEPNRVYPAGVTEWEALDEIKDIFKPNQMLWSMIYRKLKGNRGCTMITEYEQARLCALIEKKNEGAYLDCGDKALDFDAGIQEIVCKDESAHGYSGRQEPINLMPRLAQKRFENKAFEAHLQAEIVRNLGRRDDPLSQLLMGDSSVEWLGNEVSCGVGMQRIDVMFSYISGGLRHVSPVELKSVEIAPAHVRQMQRYIDWVQQYYTPNLPSIISPVLITLDDQRAHSTELRRAIQEFNARNEGGTCEKLRLVEFGVRGAELQFSLREY